MHRKFGFKEEGILREHIYHHGRYEDVIVMGITVLESVQVEKKMEELFAQPGQREETSK